MTMSSTHTTLRVVRGGSWILHHPYSWCWSHVRLLPDPLGRSYGIRVTRHRDREQRSEDQRTMEEE